HSHDAGGGAPPSPYRRREIIQGEGEQPAAVRPMRTNARAVLIDALRPVGQTENLCLDYHHRCIEERPMATRPKSEAKPADPRGKIVDALMELASEQRFEEISIRDICKTAGVTLADFRDAFPSKGAVLAGLSRRIDRAVLAQDGEELADESSRERLFDILMRRLEAMAPYREGLREVGAWLRRQPAAALAMNQVVVSSMRFMLE